MKTRKLWAWMALLASFAFLTQSSKAARAQDDSQIQDQGQDQAQAQDQSQGQDQDQSPEQDPPGRVARLNYSQGSISFRPAGEDDWVTGVPNRPMVTGDDLWADDNSRAEVHIGSTAIRRLRRLARRASFPMRRTVILRVLSTGPCADT